MLILRSPALLGYQDRTATELLEKQALLKKDVIQSLRRGDVAQVDIDVAGLGKRLPVENNVEVQLFGKGANVRLEISIEGDHAQLFSTRRSQIRRLAVYRS